MSYKHLIAFNGKMLLSKPEINKHFLKSQRVNSYNFLGFKVSVQVLNSSTRTQLQGVGTDKIQQLAHSALILYSFWDKNAFYIFKSS